MKGVPIMSEKMENSVIPLVQKMEFQNTIPPIPDGKPITKENQGSFPIQFWLTVEDKNSTPSTKTQLPIDLMAGVALTFLGGKAQLKTIEHPNQKIGLFSFKGFLFLLVFGIACIAITVLILNTKINASPTETKIVSVPDNAPKKEHKVSGLPENLGLFLEEPESVIIYETPEEIYHLIVDKDEAIKMYKEAVNLRKEAAKNDNDEHRMRQAIIRFKALLRKSGLPKWHQRQAVKQLWVIYHCHLKWYKAAQKMEALMKKYNKSAAPNERVATICPKEKEE